MMPTLKIARIETFLVPPRWMFCRVETEDGAVGWGEPSLEGHAEAVEGAFEALMSGDAATHDAKVAAALKELSKQVDVIVLAQASMARVVDTLPPEDKRTPILASPALAVDYLATVLKD